MEEITTFQPLVVGYLINHGNLLAINCSAEKRKTNSMQMA
jgi:hypothetical protein